MKVDKERLAKEFITLCEIESPSRREGRISRYLQQIFRDLGADTLLEDDSAGKTGSESGNLLIRFDGSLPLPPIFFSCHMDTVPPTQGIRVVRTGDLFTSQGDTVLGSDDKSGLVACIEAMRVLKEQEMAHRPVEFLITTCEEIGLMGAKAFDPKHMQAKEGYALDSTGFAKVITHAPAANKLEIHVAGVAAHAGLHPEWGVNAIVLAAKALADIPCGRIDEETTVNFGIIQGGVAANIVPEKVVINGEIRSHNPQKLKQLTQTISNRFINTAKHWSDPSGAARGKPRIEVRVEEDFPAMALARDSQVIRRIEQAATGIGLELCFEKAGGGSDANIFNGLGLATAIVATGMTNVHSTNEQVELEDMVSLTKLILALLSQVDY
ncbi:MAG: M20/M25/M40 family metallo-hydrolase [Desulfobulbaceae bacterium]|nr:M20/M25/M40 family metallo-hydrolase [Desulfobulbaceae bacterium]